MLIINDYNNYTSIKFNNYCKFNNIIIITMSAYLFHLLQPLDIKLFSFLKIIYNY